MPTKKAPVSFEVVDALLAAYATNDRINQFLIQKLPAEAWRMTPPGGKGRTIASMMAHIHNVRLAWLKSARPGEPLPEKLEGEDFSPKDVMEALANSHRAIDGLLRSSLSGDGRIRGIKPDVASFLGYLFAHDAHHRGQASMLARQLGHPLPQSAMYGLWEWGTR
jgi:uncharacterized damage-inducible protein DinB